MSKHDATQWYATTFKAWPKQVGPKPTAEALDTIHKLGARPGKQALANALMLRECGVTGGQIVMACGAPQLNKMRDFVAKGLAKRVPISNSVEGHTVYKLELTAKGLKRIETVKALAVKAAEGEPAKPAKAKRKAKATKVTEAPADIGGVDAERAAMPVEAPAADIQPQA